MQKVVNCGGCCSNSVSKRTRFLIMGETDYYRVKGEKSAKYRKVEQMISEGLNIVILDEEKFIEMLGPAGAKTNNNIASGSSNYSKIKAVSLLNPVVPVRLFFNEKAFQAN